VDLRAGDAATGIDQRRPASGGRTERVEQDDPDFDDTVAVDPREAGGLEVDDREAAKPLSCPQGAMDAVAAEEPQRDLLVPDPAQPSGPSYGTPADISL